MLGRLFPPRLNGFEIFALLAVALGAAFAGWSPLARAGGPTVVELFTSQSCYSCPPAEALLGELVERENLVALEFHVDYWNDLVYGKAGRWVDVFSDPAYTRRQQRYSRRIEGSRVYTPQVVIDGAVQTVGSRRGRVLRLVERSGAAAKPIDVTVHSTPSGGLRVAVRAEDHEEQAEILLARFDLRHVTDVAAGENKGKRLVNFNVVRELRRIGAWNAGRREIEIADFALGDNEGCAVLVQAAGQGPILGAAACPS